jgi:hypothetical protein
MFIYNTLLRDTQCLQITHCIYIAQCLVTKPKSDPKKIFCQQPHGSDPSELWDKSSFPGLLGRLDFSEMNITESLTSPSMSTPAKLKFA